MTGASDEALSALAHRFRTPLAVIAGFAELLGVRDDERTRLEASSQIGAAAGRLSEALEELFAAAEADADLAARLAAGLGPSKEGLS